MEVILLQKVANLGGIGDKVRVKSGYGRNYLLPKGKATLATPANIVRFEARRAELEKTAHAELSSAEQRAAALREIKLTITAKAGSEGKLFGSVGTSDIAEAATAAGHQLARSEVRLSAGPLRTVGEHHVPLHLHTDVDVDLTVLIVADEQALTGRAAMAGPLRSRRDPGPEGPDASLVPPHSVEAEQAVLGGLLIDPLAWDQVADLATADDFYRPDHRLIFAALSELAASSKPLDMVTAAEQLQRRGQLEDCGGLAYLGTLARDTPTAANVRAYAQIVRERALLRQLIHVGREITASAFNQEGVPARELVDLAEQSVFNIADAGFRGREGAQRVSLLLPPLIDKIDAWHSDPNALRGLGSGFTEFDKMTGGLRGGDLIIVAGRPGMGKTTFAMNIAEYAAVNPATRAAVAIFSMEMPSEQLVMRMLSSIGHVQLGSIRGGRISDDDWARISSATSQLSEAKIFVDEGAALTPTELRARARRIKREHGLGLVVVDYLQLMQVPGTKENRATEIAEISRGLKALAKELDIPVIALSQLNRGVEQRQEKMPVMSDLRESGAIEQDADMILMIYRDEVYDKNTTKKGIAEIELAKHRNGETGRFVLTFQGAYSRFVNHAPDSYGEGVLR